MKSSINLLCVLLASFTAACSTSGSQMASNRTPTSNNFNPKCEARVKFSGYQLEVKGISYPFGPPDASKTFTLAEASFGQEQLQKAKSFAQGIDLLGYHYCQMLRRVPPTHPSYAQLLQDYTDVNKALILVSADLEAASTEEEAAAATNSAKKQLEELGSKSTNTATPPTSTQVTTP